MNFFFVLCMTFIFINFAKAEEGNKDNATLKNEKITKICSIALTSHISDDVEYVPNVDIKGNPVVPADINPDFAKNMLPIKIPLELDLLERFNLSIPENIIADSAIAEIIIHRDGTIGASPQAEDTRRSPSF